MGIVLKNGNLIDGTGKLVKNAIVVIENSTIAAAGKVEEVRIPPGQHEVIDVEGMSILPGLIDLHDHLHGDASDSIGGKLHDRFGEQVSFTEDRDAYLAVLMVENAKKALEAGFTTIRDTGSPRDLTIDIARAERDGLFVGPRILACSTIDITVPAGKKQVHGIMGSNITGAVEAIRLAREKVGSGADWLHLRATGAAAGMWGADTELLSEEEMRAATMEAHKFGKRVTSNACGVKGMKSALRAGVDSIEHGTHIGEDDEVIKMMLDRRVGWVPTLYVSIAKKEQADAAEARGGKSGLPDYWLKRELELIGIWRRGFEKAMAAGVLTGLGTDMGAPYMVHGKNAKELEIYVRYGMSETQAIESSTRVNAEILGMQGKLGTVEAGKEADVVVVKKDPLKDIRVLQENGNVALVFKGGKIVVDRRDKTRQIPVN